MSNASTGRWAFIAGGALAVIGLRLGAARGWPFFLAGGAILCRALYEGEARRVNHSGAGITSGIYDQVAQAAKERHHPAGTLIEDIVEEASDDSFPCSDPPAWTARG
jgi:hypothetical protein